MQRKSFSGFQRGLSLIEVCITLAVVAILAGTAAPSFIETFQKRTLDGSAGELVTDLYLARSAATSHQDGVRFSMHAVAGGSCLVVHTGAVADCACASDGVAQCTNGASLIKSSFYAASKGVTVTANVASIRFDPTHGMATPAGTLRVTAKDGSAVHHVVNIMGRVRSCSPGGAMRGYKAC
jgi:type IV fimbrial biogenesis protein FimT